MPFLAGNLATVTADLTTYSGTVKTADVDDRADLLDSTVLGNIARARIKGLEDWTMILDLQFDGAAGYGTDLKPGTIIVVTVTMTPGRSYVGTGVVQSFRPKVGVDDVIRGPVNIVSNGTALVRNHG